jgi:16S rRNA C967 or C1407 C5-methylase (RsmB/RsmF family)
VDGPPPWAAERLGAALVDPEAEKFMRALLEHVETEMPGNRLKSITKGRRSVYEALKKHGMSKRRAAKIANAGKTRAGRSRMARKAARTRKRR